MNEFNGIIDEQGKLHIDHRQLLQEWIRTHPGKEVTLKIRVKGKKRSNPQNDYYWGVVVEMVWQALMDLGHAVSKKDTHDFLKAKFNPVELEVTDGHYIDIPGSTADMTTKDFQTYKERIQQFGTEFLNIYIPDPNEQQQWPQ